MINSFLFNTGSEDTGSLIQVIESGSIGSNDLTGDPANPSYDVTLSNLQTDDLILIIGSSIQSTIPAFAGGGPDPSSYFGVPVRQQTNFNDLQGFNTILEKPIDNFNTKATSFICYKIITEEEAGTNVVIDGLTAGGNEIVFFVLGGVQRAIVYNYYILRGVNPKDPYSLIVSSSTDDIGNIDILDNQSIIYSLYYQSSSFYNTSTSEANSPFTPPFTSSLTPAVNLNGSQPPSDFSSSIAAGSRINYDFSSGDAQNRSQALVHSAFRRFDETTAFDPDAFSFSNGHAGGKSTTVIVFNNLLDSDPPIKTHIVPTSSFTLNTTTGTGSWNPPPNGNTAFYDNFGIKNLNFYYKYAFPDNFTSIANTTGSGYEEPILAGTSNLVSFLENGFTKNFDSQGYYTGYYTAVDKFGNESVPADQADAFQLSEGFVAPVPEILSFESVGLGTNSFNTGEVQEDDLILAFAYRGNGTNTSSTNTSNLTLTDTATGDSFSSITLSGQDASPDISRFRAFFKFVSGSSLNGSNQMGITISGNVRDDSILQTVAVRGVTTDTPFHNFVRRSGGANILGTNNIINFPAASAIEQESKNMLILSVAGVRENTGNIGNPQPVIQDSVNSSLQLLTNPPERSLNDRSIIITAGYGQENPSDADVNSIAYGGNNTITQPTRSATLVLFINPIGFEFSPTQQTPAALTTPQLDFNIENTTVQIVGAS